MTPISRIICPKPERFTTGTAFQLRWMHVWPSECLFERRYLLQQTHSHARMHMIIFLSCGGTPVGHQPSVKHQTPNNTIVHWDIEHCTSCFAVVSTRRRVLEGKIAFPSPHICCSKVTNFSGATMCLALPGFFRHDDRLSNSESCARIDLNAIKCCLLALSFFFIPASVRPVWLITKWKWDCNFSNEIDATPFQSLSHNVDVHVCDTIYHLRTKMELKFVHQRMSLTDSIAKWNAMAMISVYHLSTFHN